VATTVTVAEFTESVAEQLSLPAGDAQRDQLPGPVAATLGFLEDWFALVPGEPWPDNKLQGAVMLAAKLHRRRNSPDSITNSGDYGPMYVARYDSDISMLLGIDKWMKPQVG